MEELSTEADTYLEKIDYIYEKKTFVLIIF